jgi:hypothetical protein
MRTRVASRPVLINYCGFHCELLVVRNFDCEESPLRAAKPPEKGVLINLRHSRLGILKTCAHEQGGAHRTAQATGTCCSGGHRGEG